MQQIINKQSSNFRIGTKVQQSLKLQHEQNKTNRRVYNRESQKAKEIYTFNLKQKNSKISTEDISVISLSAPFGKSTCR